jgi:hypothetical protein
MQVTVAVAAAGGLRAPAAPAEVEPLTLAAKRGRSALLRLLLEVRACVRCALCRPRPGAYPSKADRTDGWWEAARIIAVRAVDSRNKVMINNKRYV